MLRGITSMTVPRSFITVSASLTNEADICTIEDETDLSLRQDGTDLFRLLQVF